MLHPSSSGQTTKFFIIQLCEIALSYSDHVLVRPIHLIESQECSSSDKGIAETVKDHPTSFIKYRLLADVAKAVLLVDEKQTNLG